MTRPETLWSAPPAQFALRDGEVHVWRADLDQPPPRIRELAQTLSVDECERAERFYRPEQQNRFIVARGMLRILLGGYLNRAPQALRFCYAEHGKPALDKAALRFNLSHSHTLALYAVALNVPVGIDVEYSRRKVAREQVAARFFAPEEVAALEATPIPLKDRAFFACWTRKEAYLKARGDGVSLPLGSFAVALGEEAALLRCEGDPGAVTRWSLQALDPGPDYAAALCVEGVCWQLRCYQWSD